MNLHLWKLEKIAITISTNLPEDVKFTSDLGDCNFPQHIVATDLRHEKSGGNTIVTDNAGYSTTFLTLEVGIVNTFQCSQGRDFTSRT